MHLLCAIVNPFFEELAVVGWDPLAVPGRFMHTMKRDKVACCEVGNKAGWYRVPLAPEWGEVFFLPKIRSGNHGRTRNLSANEHSNHPTI